ncbi:RNA polymerase sigma factor [Melittangium boletus]|uniref:RNA polymerase sigma 70 n=1 Tax=Melittangium boletus DSM 14713 TaxID=1294270 RepID=A0A250ISJ8_9BACT|nr:sigma-70 family RNA polymerase sigma factor [Melittangium boletus]ATB34141.1 RNA polymerase sigma 70 [Melittangium boletus DSM 14713]
MHADERELLEREIQGLSERGDVAGAVERALQGYGQEILRLMTAMLHDPDRGRDAFSVFSENLLRGLPGFRWESSFRTWAYRLARNACVQVMRSPAVRREQPVSMSAMPEEPFAVRSDTRPWQRTSVKERFRALRESLDPQERLLLSLRVDQRLSWEDVAKVMAEGEEPLPAAALKRRAAALRQQFQRVKEHLRTLAEQEGLVASGDSSPSV